MLVMNVRHISATVENPELEVVVNVAVIDVDGSSGKNAIVALPVGIISYGVAAGNSLPSAGGVLKAVLVLQGGLGVVVTFN